MGWLHESTPSTKSSYVDSLLKRNFAPTNPDSPCTLLDHSLRGNNLWALAKPRDQDPFIVLFLLRSDQGCWGYKDMDESMGPYYYDCPLKFLDQAPEPVGCNRDHASSGRTWRDYVRDYHATTAQRRANRPKVGDLVRLCANAFPGYQSSYTVTKDLGRKGLILDNYLRVNCKQIRYLQPVAVAAAS